MSRSNYSDDLDQWSLICWRGAVKKAIEGKRGQAFLRKLKSALEELPHKRLEKDLVVKNGNVCAIGALVIKEGGDSSRFEKYIEDGDLGERLADNFGVAYALIAEIIYENDDHYYNFEETPESRYQRMFNWITQNIKVNK